MHKTCNPEFNETLTFYGVTENDLAVRSIHILILGKGTVSIFIIYNTILENIES